VQRRAIAAVNLQRERLHDHVKMVRRIGLPVPDRGNGGGA
jgi:hypothetical protein